MIIRQRDGLDYQAAGSRSTGGVDERKTNSYISDDKFSQEGIFHYWAGRLPGHTHVNQTYPDVVRMWRQFHGCPASGGGIERVFFSAGKQDDTLKKRTMDKTLEITLKVSINTTLPTCDDKGVFTTDDDTYTCRTHIGMFRPIRMDHTNCLQVAIKTLQKNTSSLQCQEVGTEEEGDEDGGCDIGLLSGFSLACLIC